MLINVDNHARYREYVNFLNKAIIKVNAMWHLVQIKARINDHR